MTLRINNRKWLYRANATERAWILLEFMWPADSRVAVNNHSHYSLMGMVGTVTGKTVPGSVYAELDIVSDTSRVVDDALLDVLFQPPVMRTVTDTGARTIAGWLDVTSTSTTYVRLTSNASASVVPVSHARLLTTATHTKHVVHARNLRRVYAGPGGLRILSRKHMRKQG